MFFQLVRENPDPAFDDQLLMGGFDPAQVSIGMGIALVVFLGGIFASGSVLRRFRRTTIMAAGIVGGLVMMAAFFGVNHSAEVGFAGRAGLVLIGLAGLFVLAGATPAALGMLADISETHPADRGAIMGLYSIFLGLGQIVGSVVAGSAADWQGIDGLLLASVVLLGSPSCRCGGCETPSISWECERSPPRAIRRPPELPNLSGRAPTIGAEDPLIPDRFDEHTVIFLVRSPDAPEMSEEALDALQVEHLTYLRSLKHRGVLIANGPLAEQTDVRMRGMSVYRLPLDEALALARQDPMVLAGRLVIEGARWMTAEGAARFGPEE